jgi:hypothetical protein
MSAEHLRAASDCVHRHPGLAAEQEQLFVDRAETLDADHFRVMTRRWLEHAADAATPDATMNPPSDREGPGGAPAPLSHLHASRTLDGCLRLDGWFARADADVLDAALGAGVDRMLRAAADGDPSVDGRAVSALRAGALVDLAAQSMRREPSDFSAPDRYRVAVVVRVGEATNPPEATCDAVAYRAVLGAKGEVLDIGQQSARWPPAVRRAITLRDGGCIFPGCDRPPSWSDIHHCTPFSEDGRTSVVNGALLCRRHHRFVHAHGWRVKLECGLPVVRRADGQPHLIRRWHGPHERGDMTPAQAPAASKTRSEPARSPQASETCSQPAHSPLVSEMHSLRADVGPDNPRRGPVPAPRPSGALYGVGP